MIIFNSSNKNLVYERVIIRCGLNVYQKQKDVDVLAKNVEQIEKNKDLKILKGAEKKTTIESLKLPDLIKLIGKTFQHKTLMDLKSQEEKLGPKQRPQVLSAIKKQEEIILKSIAKARDELAKQDQLDDF